MIGYIITSPAPKKIKDLIVGEAYVIAVDDALNDCVQQGIPVDLAVGDFDSLKDHRLLDRFEVIRLNKEKDKTDTEAAVDEAYRRVFSLIVLLGGIGGSRIEHQHANISLLKRYEKIGYLANDETKIMILSNGIHAVKFKGFISIFAEPRAIITLEGFKYPLDHFTLHENDTIGISNELIDDTGVITVHQGNVMVYLTKK